MLFRIRMKRLIYLPFYFSSFIFVIILVIIFIQHRLENFQTNDLPLLNISNRLSRRSLLEEINKDSKFIGNNNKTLETKIKCVGSLSNQSCLYENLYYIDKSFMILTVKGRYLPFYSVRTNSFDRWSTTPNKRQFDSYSDLEKFVRNIIDPTRIPSVTLYFGQHWHSNIGHALFDGLYPAYVALIRFAPRHKQPFRILASIGQCQNCMSEDIYSRFGGLGLVKMNVLNKMSNGRWFVFDELVMGSGMLCQRCTQPHFRLPGGIELNASTLFRNRIYQQHDLMPPILRDQNSAQGRTSRDLLFAYIIYNKRFTYDDKQEINDAIEEINTYTNMQLNNNNTQLKWPLIHVYNLHYDQIKSTNINSLQTNSTENHFTAQLKILRKMDIHVSGPGTGQMYQTFLSDGSVHINLGCLKPGGEEHTEKAYASYLEQYIASGTPYIKALYYPMNERPKGIRKDELVRLIRKAGQLILQGFSIPVNPRENLAADGQLFLEMCQKDEKFCSLITERFSDRDLACLDFWVEDFLREYNQWNSGGFIDNNGRNVTCPFNRTLLYQLKQKYGFKDKKDHWFKQFLSKFSSLMNI